jgi:hypothetical protein
MSHRLYGQGASGQLHIVVEMKAGPLDTTLNPG